MNKPRLIFPRALQLLLIAVIVLIAVPVFAGNDSYQDAVDAAENWLYLVDNGKYQDSWEQASDYFKSAVLKEDWSRIVEAVRSPLGNVISRKLKSKQYATSLPGAPDGEYVVIQFETSFQNKKRPPKLSHQ